MNDKKKSSFRLSRHEFSNVLAAWGNTVDVYGPRRFAGRSRMTGQDVIQYGAVAAAEDFEWREKSDFSAKEVLFPPNETMFHLIDDSFQETSSGENMCNTLVFCRACDINGVDRLDRIFLENGDAPDPYYQRRRARLRFALIECAESMENCFCVSMDANETDNYAVAVRFLADGDVLLRIRDKELSAGIPAAARQEEFSPRFVQTDNSPVAVPEREKLDREIRDNDLFDHPMWEEYSRRCIACGRCNFSCPTCSCFSTVDAPCDHAPELGVRRRVWAGCHVDRFTEMAGGHDVRTDYGSRMRFKTMHKIYDYNMRFGVHMCVGCGRCDDQCPEYISFSNCINRISELVDEQ